MVKNTLWSPLVNAGALPTIDAVERIVPGRGRIHDHNAAPGRRVGGPRRIPLAECGGTQTDGR